LQQQPAAEERSSTFVFDAHGQRSAAMTQVVGSGPGAAVSARLPMLLSTGPPGMTTTDVAKSSVVKGTNASPVFGESGQSPSMPVLTPQVSLATAGGLVTARPLDEITTATTAVGFQNTYLDSLARSQITDKRSGVRPRHVSTSGAAQAGGRPLQPPPPPLLSPPSSLSAGSPRLSAAFATTGSAPALQASNNPLIAGSRTPSVIQQTPRFDAPPSAAQLQQPAGLGMGGVGSQIRAMQQHIPPNTRLVRGPNGQVTVQKVQTIELSQEMQHVS
jgi:hypothetical protein